VGGNANQKAKKERVGVNGRVDGTVLRKKRTGRRRMGGGETDRRRVGGREKKVRGVQGRNGKKTPT